MNKCSLFRLTAVVALAGLAAGSVYAAEVNGVTTTATATSGGVKPIMVVSSKPVFIASAPCYKAALKSLQLLSFFL
jgi:hypothetical protein